MPSKKGSLSYYTAQLRDMGERRIARLQRSLETATTDRTRSWIKSQIKEIKSASQGTRIVNPKTGARYKSKTEAFIAKQATRLAKAISKVPQTYTAKRDTFKITEQQLNLASVEAPSVYTHTETRLFYRVMQDIWEPAEREWVRQHPDGDVKKDFNRNQAILDAYNREREANGLSPMQLDEIVQSVLDENSKAIKVASITDTDFEDDEDAQRYYEAQQQDNEDGDAGSPPGVGQKLVNEIRDSLKKLFTTPDPTQI